MTLTPSSSPDTRISQLLFDEAVLENEECFDLSPSDALRETIDQFCQQLGVAPPMTTAPSPTSVLAADNPPSSGDGATATSNAPAIDAESSLPPSISAPAALSHLHLSHPNSVTGQRDRSDRTRFQTCLDLLDGCISPDGTVKLGLDDEGGAGEERVLQAFKEIGRRCRLGDGSFNKNDNKRGETTARDDCDRKMNDPLPYLALFQSTSSIYTFMSFLGILDGVAADDAKPTVNLLPDKQNGHLATATRFRILKAAVTALWSILSTRKNEKCALLRAQLRDSFVPALHKLVCLIGEVVNTVPILAPSISTLELIASKEIKEPAEREELLLSLSMQQLSCDLLQLGTNATRGCEAAKVTFVQSSLSSKLQDAIIVSAGNNAVTKRGGVAVVVSCLSVETLSTNDCVGANFTHNLAQLWTEACRLFASLCRYDDFRGTGGHGGAATPAMSSAHDHVMEFHRAGATIALIKIAKRALSELQAAKSDDEEEMNAKSRLAVAEENHVKRLALAVLTALRVLAVNDEIIQTMVALGLLPIAANALELCVNDFETVAVNEAAQSNKQWLASASLGLLRNICGNDEIKTNLCLGSSKTKDPVSSSCTTSVLPHLLQSMRLFPSASQVQEHACGTLAAMALRRPDNARCILNTDGPRWILLAMRHHPQNANVQRQGSLAVRNIASRLLRDLPGGDGGITSGGNSAANTSSGGEEEISVRDAFLDLGAEEVLRDIAGQHQASVDEAYAALLCLQCKVSLLKFSAEDLQKGGRIQPGRTRMFGEKHNSAFRPVYEESQGLSEGVASASIA